MGQPLKFVDYFRHTIAPSGMEMGTSSVPLASATNEKEWLSCYFESSGQTSYGMRIQIEKTSATAGAPRAVTLRTILGHSSGHAPQGANSVDARVTLETGNTGISGEMHAMESQCRVDAQARSVNGTYAAHKFTNNFGANNTMPVDTFFLRFYDAGTVKTPRLFGFTGLTAGTGNLYYNETLKIKVNTNDRWIPLSSAQGTYTSAYAVSLGLAAGSVLSFTGAATNAIDFTSATLSRALHFVDAFTGQVIETGTYESNVDKGVILSATNYRPVSFLFDDSDATLGAANYRGVLSRIYIGHDQAGEIAIRSIRGQLKFKDGVDINVPQNQFGSMNGVDGFIETAGDHTMGSKTRIAAVHATVGIASGTVTLGHVLAGLMAELNINSTGSISGGITAGLYIDQVHSDHGLTCPWPYGIYIPSGAATIGIDVAVAATASGKYGIYVHNTYTKNDGGVHKAICSEVTYTPSAAGYSTPIAIVGKVSLDGTFQTSTGYMWGVQGQLDFTDNAVTNQAASVFAAVRAVMTASATPTFTEADSISCLYCDNLSAYDMTGLSTGYSSMIRLQAGQGVVDSALHVYGPSMVHLFNFENCQAGEQMITQNAETGGTAQKIKCLFNGVTYYMNMYTG